MRTLRLAVLSGVLGASASCLAKFAFSSESSVAKWTQASCLARLERGNAVITILPVEMNFCDLLSWIPRGLCLLGMVVLNIIMVGAFVEGMQESGSVAGTALASAANFGASALYGILLWDETVNTTWLVGFGFVILGVMLLSTVQVRPSVKEE